MEAERFAPSVRRIVSFEMDSSGVPVAVTVYRQRGQRKKGSRFLGPLETATRRLANAGEAAASGYLKGHRRSGRKRRDGWLRDLALNTARATHQGAKQLKVYRLFGF